MTRSEDYWQTWLLDSNKITVNSGLPISPGPASTLADGGTIPLIDRRGRLRNPISGLTVIIIFERKSSNLHPSGINRDSERKK
jgi:hypothetical protein